MKWRFWKRKNSAADKIETLGQRGGIKVYQDPENAVFE
jgi:hypothetical protein